MIYGLLAVPSPPANNDPSAFTVSVNTGTSGATIANKKEKTNPIVINFLLSDFFARIFFSPKIKNLLRLKNMIRTKSVYNKKFNLYSVFLIYFWFFCKKKRLPRNRQTQISYPLTEKNAYASSANLLKELPPVNRLKAYAQ